MIRFVFSVEDLARTRFAISPMWEAIRSLVALQDPSSAALHLPWLRSLSGRLGGLALEPVVALIPPRGYMPDFLTPPPSGPLGGIDDDLDALRRTPVKQIRHDVELFGAQHPRAGISDGWLEHPRREVRRLADVIEGWWSRAIEPAWPRIQAFLDGDIAYRASRLARGGPAGLFADLHPDVAWGAGHLDVLSDRDATIELDGRGLVLLPSAFQWARPATIAAPRSTADIAELLSISPAGASHHLTTLRDAGLATARREGRTVLYVRTPVGDALARR